MRPVELRLDANLVAHLEAGIDAGRILGGEHAIEVDRKHRRARGRADAQHQHRGGSDEARGHKRARNRYGATVDRGEKGMRHRSTPEVT